MFIGGQWAPLGFIGGILQSISQVRGAVFTYARDNIAVVKVFARDPYYTLIQRDKKMTTISFVGNTGCLPQSKCQQISLYEMTFLLSLKGGLIGLCLGFSFVSLVKRIEEKSLIYIIRLRSSTTLELPQ